MYSIFDNDTQQYLHTGRNSQTKQELFDAYLSYRQHDLMDCERWHFIYSESQIETMDSETYEREFQKRMKEKMSDE